MYPSYGGQGVLLAFPKGGPALPHAVFPGLRGPGLDVETATTRIHNVVDAVLWSVG